MIKENLSVYLYGSEVCEDSALVRDRLRALRVPFELRNRESEPEIDIILARWNRGNLVTPTLVFGDDAQVISEPTLEQLEETLRAAGYKINPPSAVEIHDDRKNRPAPNFTLPATVGPEVQLSKLRARNRAVLFFAHAPDCRVCQGYARQLTARKAEIEETEARLLLIVPGDPKQAHHWSHEFARGHPVLVDRDGRVKRAYADYFHPEGADEMDVLLLILDLYTAPRAGSFAADAGGLIAPSEILGWLRVLECECSE